MKSTAVYYLWLFDNLRPGTGRGAWKKSESFWIVSATEAAGECGRGGETIFGNRAVPDVLCPGFFWARREGM
jgi:hypothetical protein